jgi:hypothetical protein
MKNAEYWIKKLELKKRPEGGYFKEVYRSCELIREDVLHSRYKGSRAFSTSIYFLLKGSQVSCLHRIKSDELWHFYQGSPLIIHLIGKNGEYSQINLGYDFERGQVFQTAVPAGLWFCAEVSDRDSYSLVGCTVAPGFDFSDFELGKKKELLALYPQHKKIIEKFTKLQREDERKTHRENSEVVKFKLRKFKAGDEESLMKNINNVDIARNTLTIPYPYTTKDARSWIKRNLKLNRVRKPAEINFVIEINGEVAGALGFAKIDRTNKNAEVGYWLAKKYWGQGIMTDALKEMTKLGFEKHKLRRIYAYVFAPNKASQRVLEKAGFVLEGKLKKHKLKKGKYYDSFLYAKIR